MNNNRDKRSVPVSCPTDCGGGCPLLARMQGGRIVRLTNNPLGGRYLQGCIKGFRAAEALDAPDRLLKPLIRSGPRSTGRFREVSWREALDYTAAKMADIRRESGPEAFLNLGGSGSWRAALHNTANLANRFFSLFGGSTQKTGSYSSQALRFTKPFVLGDDWVGSDPQTIEHSRMILLWGANPAEARMGPEWLPRLRRARRNGAALIVLDPRRTETAKKLNAEWVPLRPGSDVALMLAILYVLITEDLIDHDFIARCCSGFSALADRVLGRLESPRADPEWAAAICGLTPEAIIHLARRYGRAKPAALIPGLSIQRTLGGEDTVRLAVALQAATGNIGRPGGWTGVFPYHATPSPRMARPPVPPDSAQAEIPVYCWADAVLEGRAGGWPSDIKAIYNLGTNYLTQGADVSKNIQAFKQAELVVCHDLFLTPTARYSDVVLPPAHFLERSDLVTPAGGNYLLYSAQAARPRAKLPTDYEILCGLAKRMGFGPEFSENRGQNEWLNYLIDHSEVPDPVEFKRTGIHIPADQPRIGLAEFVADPKAHPLSTPSGLIELTGSFHTGAGLSAAPEQRKPEDLGEYPFQLVTPKVHNRIHSQGCNLAWTQSSDQQRLWLNPADGSELGLSDGDPALVENSIGRVRVPVRLTGDIRPGAACLAEGAWPRFDGQGVEIAGSANALTSTEPTRPSMGSRTHSVTVRIVKAF